MKIFPILSDLKYICKLMHESFRLPIFFLNKKGALVFEFSSTYIQNPLHSSKQVLLLDELFRPEDPYQLPILRTTKYFENFFSISIRKDNTFKGTIIVGPTIPSKLSEEAMNGFINDLSISFEKKEIIQYYQSLPVFSNLKMIHASLHLYYMIYNKKLDTTTVLQQNKLLEKMPSKIEKADLSVSLRRQNISFHIEPIHEKKLLQCIKEGRKEELLNSLKVFTEKGRIGTLSKTSHLRSQKNIAIATITMATRAAVEGGLHYEFAYSLSDLYIQSLEELKNSNAVNTFLISSLCNFAERVQKCQKQKYSKPINDCQNYIFTNLYEDLTLSKLADVAVMHPNYLSAQFKKEVGISISEYIQREKMEEAKKLMTFTDYSISEIYTLLNFHDQSYFTKVFKKWAGVTPKQFKLGFFN